MHVPFILTFLQKLRHNNSKVWMDEHREEYLQAKAYFVEMVAYQLAQLQQFDEALYGVKAQECIFRINKNDFSKKGEAPYKGHFGAGISPGGRHSAFANYVLVLEPGGLSRIGGGMRKPGSKQLQLIREEIDYNPGQLRQVLEEPAFSQNFGSFRGEKTSNAPKGYDKAHPELELIKHKGFQVLHYFSDEEVSHPQFIERLPPLFRQVKPLHDFLNNAITELQ
ncbi:DUF2461 domain-containing protein [Pontibacter anaerobius]|uniref:DUF2461 domain-containing protein n=1 Tax=Pontibacter anaerobius TaxID=2993940 RepID=A0ABT3REV3_9BACT|nr:DUF2461 domain-containing protein [Pontibacter anaerobius]MCX2740041.1 DUF2461 domain-containing protein [Pontibacter anaerobius]